MIIAILLDGGSQQNIFYAGQNVSGNVRVELKDEIKMRGIRVEVHGNSKVQWTEGQGKSRRHYTCTETLMDFKTYLTGSDKDSEMTLKAGVHTFPLNFVLPSTVPSSFQGYHGYIKYTLRAVVNRIRRLDDSTEIPITVIHTLNLNNEPPEVKGPVVVLEEKPMVGCCVTCCCIKGLPEIELRMNRGGFVPGETIILNGKVVNKSNTNIKKTVINFIQEIEYIVMNSKGKVLARKFQYKTLDSTKRSKIHSGSTDTWSDVSFVVPSVTESRLDGSHIINITYFIQVKVDFAKGCCADSGIRQDIVIGHVPIQGDTRFGEPVTTQPLVYTSPFQSGIATIPDQSSHSGVHGEGWKQGNSTVSAWP